MPSWLGWRAPPASVENRWAGNRGGFEDPRAQQLVDAYRRSISGAEQLRTIKALSDFVAGELPLLILYYTPRHLGVRTGLRALEDVAGGAEASLFYGTFTRNAHLWELL